MFVASVVHGLLTEGKIQRFLEKFHGTLDIATRSTSTTCPPMMTSFCKGTSRTVRLLVPMSIVSCTPRDRVLLHRHAWVYRTGPRANNGSINPRERRRGMTTLATSLRSLSSLLLRHPFYEKPTHYECHPDDSQALVLSVHAGGTFDRDRVSKKPTKPSDYSQTELPPSPEVAYDSCHRRAFLFML